jgi:hypothetical protein
MFYLLLSQYIFPGLLYTCLKFFCYRGDLFTTQVILNHSNVVTIFICSMKLYFILCFYYPFPSFIMLNYFIITVLLYFYVFNYYLFFNELSSSGHKLLMNYLRRFILVVYQGSVVSCQSSSLILNVFAYDPRSFSPKGFFS